MISASPHGLRWGRLRFNPVIPLTALAIGKDAAGRCAWSARESSLGVVDSSMDWAGRGVLCLGVSERLVSSRLQRFVKDGNIVGQAIFENRDLKEDLSPLSSSLRDEMFSIVF